MKHLIKHTALLLYCLGIQSVLAQTADTALTSGKILTVDNQFSIVSSLAIADGRIIATGSEDDIAPFIDNNTTVIELQGKTVIPGLIDNHFHFIRGAWNYQQEARLDGIKSRTAALDKLHRKTQEAGKGQWVTVMGGWIADQFLDNNAPFTLSELDALAPENPVFLMRNYSEGYANSRAFELTGIDHNGNARISGRDNIGTFVNQVSWRNKSASPPAILNYMQALNRVGLTTVYDVGRPSEGSLEPLQSLADTQALPLRVFYTLRYSARNAESTRNAIDVIEGGQTLPRSNTAQYGLIGLGEHIYVPVSDNPRHTGLWSTADWEPFSQISYAAARHQWPVHEHVMSGATAEQYLNLIEQIAAEVPTVRNLRWTFAHANGMTGTLIQRAADLGVALAVHSQARMSVRAIDAPRIGSIARSGALWGLGSDAGIVASVLPFTTLEWAVAGTNIAGKPAWSDDQRVSREAALTAHTRNNASLLFMEDQLGSLEVGKLADLVVLDKDYLTIAEQQISEINPLLTITNGRVVYQKH
ncbi:MAG: amidohydrolase family protein [Pseudomonadota bacterium]